MRETTLSQTPQVGAMFLTETGGGHGAPFEPSQTPQVGAMFLTASLGEIGEELGLVSNPSSRGNVSDL